MKQYTFDLTKLADETQLLKLDKNSAWVVRGNGGEIEAVLENRCAHMGSQLRCIKSGFICDSHNWTYGPTGLNDVSGNPGLNRLEYSLFGKELNIYLEDEVPIFEKSNMELNGSEYLELISHATFLLESDGKKIIFDPWIKGDTYWGAWTLFPKHDFDIERLKEIDAIVITHPHPDHFHPETLELFSRDIDIYIPSFPSRILNRALMDMGFTNVKEVEWEVEYEICDSIKVAFLRPNSFWEDSAILVGVKSFIWLNQNDSGAPLKGNLIPKKVDLLTTSFDFGASGYPLTWQMQEDRRKRIIDNGKKQILETLRNRCDEVNAKYFAPFAGYWRHGLEEHQIFADSLKHTRLEEIAEILETSETNFIPTIPSSQVHLKTMTHQFNASVRSSLDEPFRGSRAEISLPEMKLNPEELRLALETNLRLLAQMSTATNSEFVMFKVVVPKLSIEIEQVFGKQADSTPIQIQVTISPDVAQLVANGDVTATWNHVDIGYLGFWERSPDTYPVKFMRLLQLGYVHELVSSNETSSESILETPVATFLEAQPEFARILLNRAGLPCASCGLTNKEKLSEALEMHKVGSNQRETLVNELKAIVA